MSWSLIAVGRKEGVLKALAAQDEAVRSYGGDKQWERVRALLKAEVEAFTPAPAEQGWGTNAISIDASGHHDPSPGGFSNVRIEVKYLRLAE